ncbi:related to endo alpha-1,4 polygalactosaminidase precusor [Fusarium torulosum]|uniref:alpha-galactosidase n=1 Tax=Fusarium torulosum TaxID=33205 RepID=A0AAE8MM26_9HYPO|nr:related to endo alpha-1,4 polygalactosaminidase precusor [Fusarium torulosum]
MKSSAMGKNLGSWPLWKKLVVAGIILIIVIPLSVGLGVGLSRSKGGSNDDTDDDGNNDDSSGGTSGNTPNHTSLWQPEVGASWQIILLKPIEVHTDTKIEPDVEIFDLDLYDNDASTFAALKKLGKKVICYFSAGSYENWRDDKEYFHEADLGKPLDGWPGERWLNISSPNVRSIMKKRIEMAAKKGCDAIDPDNVDGFQNNNGLKLTQNDTVNFVKFLSETAASFNVSTGLKNAGSVISEVISDVHFSVNEQCVEYSECDTFAPFIDHGKPVFHIEYPKGAPGKTSTKTVGGICSGKGKADGSKGFSTVIKKMNLDTWVEYCDGKTYGS